MATLLILPLATDYSEYSMAGTGKLNYLDEPVHSLGTGRQFRLKWADIALWSIQKLRRKLQTW